MEVLQENGIRSYRALKNQRHWRLCKYLDADLKCAAVTWNLYRWDENKWLRENPSNEQDLQEMKERMKQDRPIFDYIDRDWSVGLFDLDRVPNMSMEYIRKLCTGGYQLGMCNEYISYTQENR